MKPIHIVMAIVVQLAFAFQLIAIKIGVTQFPPFLMVALRFLCMALLLVPFVKRPVQHQLRPILAITLTLNVLHFGLFYAGIRHVDASSAAILYQLVTPFATLLALIFLQDRLSRQGIFGIALAFAGVVMVAGAPTHDSSIGGLLLIGAGTLSFALGNVLIRRFGPFDPLMLNGWAALLTAPPLMLASLLLEQGQQQALISADFYGWAALAYTVLGGGIFAFGVWYFLLGQYPVSQVMPYMLLSPVFGVVDSVLFLDERLTWRLVLGGLIAILGVAIVQFSQPRQPAKLVQEP